MRARAKITGGLTAFGLLWRLVGSALAAPATPVAPCVTSSSNASGVTIENCAPVTAASPLPVTVVGGPVVTVAPYAYTPLTPSQFNLPVVASTGLTIPTGATLARACVRIAEVESTIDGTAPTIAPRGTALPVGSCTVLSGPLVLAAFRAISATGTLDVEYFK